MKKIFNIDWPTPDGICYKTVRKDYSSVFAPKGLGRCYDKEGETHVFPDAFPSHVFTPEVLAQSFERARMESLWNQYLILKDRKHPLEKHDAAFLMKEMRHLVWSSRAERSSGSRVLVCQSPLIEKRSVVCFPFWEKSNFSEIPLWKLWVYELPRLVCWKLTVLGELEIDPQDMRWSWTIEQECSKERVRPHPSVASLLGCFERCEAKA